MSDATRLNVLVVDDDADVRDVIEEMFVALGHDVTPVADSDQAISRFLSQPFDLITLDYRMPGLDGAGLHKLLSEEFGAGKRTSGFTPKKLPPIAIITGHPDDPDVMKTQFGESVLQILRKPVVLDDLAKLVEAVLKERDKDEQMQ